MLRMQAMISIGSILDRDGGIGGGFAFLRVFLATLVVFYHSFVVVGGDPLSQQELWFIGYSVLAVFFSLSGFLITGSALRLSLPNFLLNRSARIVPALAMDIVLSALILGPIVTTVSTADYFSDISFYKYFFNILGFPHYVLPGVFTTHPWPQVNISLWTIPWEISCYIIMASLIYLRMLNRTFVIMSMAAAITMVGVIIVGLDHGFPVHYQVHRVIHYFLGGTGSRLVICFLLGILFFQYRHSIPYSWTLFAICVLWCLGLAAFVRPYSIMSLAPIMNVFAAIPMVYITIFLGMTRIPELPILRHGDYSYGIYLYAFPIQQVVYALHPGKFPIANFCLSMPFVLAFAMISWHLVEKPILAYRKKFSFSPVKHPPKASSSAHGTVSVSDAGARS